MADYIGSTSGIIDYASSCEAKEFIIGTEQGVLYELRKKNPDKVFHLVSDNMFCHDMKKVTLEKVLSSLENMNYQMEVNDEVRNGANHSLNRMLELGSKKNTSKEDLR